MFRVHQNIKRLRNIAVATVLAAAQILAPITPLIKAETVSAAPVCTVDTAGANDEPGQKDLNKLCVDYAGLPTTVATTWNWDETGTNGANTMDACNLFDTDGDGNINYAVCVTTNNDPAQLQTLTTYSCGDAKIDRCTTPATAISSGTTSCTVSQQNTDPFPGPPNSAKGAAYPVDTQGSCTIQLSTIGGATAKLIDVCSYPSAQPNSDPSDCVIIQDQSGKIEVRKNLIPNNNTGLFNLQVDGTTRAANVGHNGTTGEVVVTTGNHSVGETAGTNTLLSSYATSVECRDLNGTGAVIASGSVTTLANIPVADGADIVCIITNTAAGSITIVKDAVANSLQDFGFTTTGTGLSDFALDDDSGVTGASNTLSNTTTFNNVGAGTYTITETATSGWDLASIVCSQGANVVVNGGTVTINLTAGQNVTCTFRNEQRGQLIVNKVTDPANDPTQFGITASGTGTIFGNANQNVSTSQNVTYSVGFGTYAVSEQVPAGWSETSNTCSNLVFNGNTPLVNGVPTRTCTITNTKLGTLTILKDALPNDAQDFVFNTVNLPTANFTLDDDADATESNQQQFTNLAPGNYSVTEQSTPGWTLTGLTCDTNNFTVNGGTVNVALAAGQNTTCTFTNTKLGSISGTKFDVDADSTINTPLSGWTIFLDTNANGILDANEASTVTDVNGDYNFTDLMPGNYTVEEVLTTGWTQIFGAAPVVLSAGTNATDVDFGNFENGSIEGYKFNDVNGNGQEDRGEQHLSGWTITLYNDGTDADTDLDDVVSSTQTDTNGDYSFTDLAPGTYAVCETQQTNWVQTLPANNACYTIVIDESGELNEEVIFGNQGRGNIQVIKNVDTDGDGVVDLTNTNTWTWDIDGTGNFATGSTQNVAAGTYTVSEDQQANYHVVDVVCDNQDPVVSTSTQVTVGVGQTVVCTFTNQIDNGSISGTKYEVLLNAINGIGGTPLSGWTIFIDANANGTLDAGEVSAVTDANGNYTFDDLTPGTYTICEVLQNGWLQVFPAGNSDCITVNLQGGVHLTDVDFGNIPMSIICINNIITNNTNNQTATTGSTNIINNTNVGGGQSGNATNSNSIQTFINLNCGGMGAGPTGGPSTPPTDPTPTTTALPNTGLSVGIQNFIIGLTLLSVALVTRISRLPGRMSR